MKDHLHTIVFVLLFSVIFLLLICTIIKTIAPLFSPSEPQQQSDYEIDEDFNYNLSASSDDWYDEYCALQSEFDWYRQEVINKADEARYVLFQVYDEDIMTDEGLYAIDEATDILQDLINMR